MRFSALGDVAMLSPVVREYALQHPEDSVTVLSVPFCAPLFEDIAPNVSFLGRAVKTQYRGIMGLFRLFKELHAMHFDRIVDAHDVLRTKVLRQYFRLSGYEVRVINKHRSERRQLTAEPGKKVLQQLPTSFENYAEALWGGDFSGLSGTAGYSGLSSDSGFSGYSGYSGLSSYSGDSGPLPPGGGRVGAVGRTSGLAAELELMRGLDVMLSMDSANMHLASLVGTRVVSVWGATHPYAGFLGWGQRAEDCVQKDLPCRPCSIYGSKPCRYGDYRCLNSITPEEIVKAVTSKG